MKLVIAATVLTGLALTQAAIAETPAEAGGPAPKSHGAAGATGPGAAPMTMPNAAAVIAPTGGSDKERTAPSSAGAVVDQSPTTPR